MFFSTRYPRHRHRPTFAVLAATLSVAALDGCVVGPAYHPPSFPAPPAYKETVASTSPDGVTWTPAQPQDDALRGKWWEIYHEPELDALEEKLNISDQNIVQSFQNFQAARAQVRQAQAAYYPSLTFGPSYSRSRTSANEVGGVSGAGGANLESNEFSLPFDISWEPDIWGRVRNTVREYKAAAQVSAADLANERLSEQANLAVDYFELRGQDSMIELYQKMIVAYQTSLNLTRIRVSTGVDDELSVAQAQLTLKNAQAAATNLGVARAQYEHAIALLTGQPASAFAMPHRTLAAEPPAIPVGVPSELLQRRPDIAAAERRLAQANALIGVQVAANYPTLSLTGEAGAQSLALSNLFTAPSRFYSVTPSVSQTLFDGGLRRSEVAQYKAQYEADLAAYRRTVLVAFQQTEDDLATDRLLTGQRRQQREAVAAARRYYDLADARYRTGVDTYLNVFAAEASLLSDEQSDVTLHVQQMTNGVQLIEALGGGWDAAALPSGTLVAGK